MRATESGFTLSSTTSVDAGAVDTELRMVVVSEKVAADDTLARQLRRNFV